MKNNKHQKNKYQDKNGKGETIKYDNKKKQCKNVFHFKNTH